MAAQTRKGPWRGAAVLVAVALTAAACGSAPGASGPSATGRGRVDVLYAGSLVQLVERDLGPAFRAQAGYAESGYPGGSTALANEIKSKLYRGDVFLSASPKADAALAGAANGNWVTWYATFARSPLVLAYNPRSRFAAQLATKPWWQVVTEPGFRLGRTDPALDPKGALTVQALDQAATADHDPALAALARGTAGVYPEEDLVGRLQAGQLDAGFFYSVEADAVSPRLPTVSLSPLQLGATYTVTVLRGAPDPAGAAAFVKFLLSPGEKTALADAGLQVDTPKVEGNPADVPAELRPVLGLTG